MENLLRIAGGLLVGLALLHGAFPRRFHWRRELESVSLLTRQIHYSHTFFVALTILLMGLLCLGNAPELAHTTLGRRISTGLFVFWLFRLVIQHIGFSSALWKGKTFETAIHVVFTLVWVFLVAVFGTVAFMR